MERRRHFNSIRNKPAWVFILLIQYRVKTTEVRFRTVVLKSKARHKGFSVAKATLEIALSVS